MLKYVCLMNIFNSLKHTQHFHADNFKKKKKKKKIEKQKKKFSFQIYKKGAKL